MTIPDSDFVILPYIVASATPLLVKEAGTYSYFGPRLSLSSLPQRLETWAGTTVEGDLITPLADFLEQVHSFVSQRARERDHYWLDIRATQISDKWNMPRWHTDGNFFLRSNE